MLTASSSDETKIEPAPSCPVLAALLMTAITSSTTSSETTISTLVLGKLTLVQGEVQCEHVDPRLPEEAEGASFDVPLDELPHHCGIELADPRHTRDLVERRGGADMRVQSAAR